MRRVKVDEEYKMQEFIVMELKQCKKNTIKPKSNIELNSSACNSHELCKINNFLKILKEVLFHSVCVLCLIELQKCYQLAKNLIVLYI